MHIKSVLRLLSLIQLLIALLMFIPLLLAVHYDEEAAFEAFFSTILLMFFTSGLCLIFTRTGRLVIKAKDSYLLVTLTWVLATAYGALPLYLTKTLPSYASCYFEIMSGFTTTGATALVTIEDKMRSILFWRNMTNWLGGMGIVVLFVAILPFIGTKGTSLVSAESVGPTKDKLTPKIQHTAFALWAIYLGFSVAEVLLLWVRIPLFDAVTVTFGTMGAAGFSPMNASIGGYGSVYVDVVVIIFMIIAGANFAIYFKLIKKKFYECAHDRELRDYLLIILVFTLFITFNLLSSGTYETFYRALRYALFHVVSIITTTGFAITDYNVWPAFSKTMLLLLFFVGGCAGSAGGGIKVVRVSTMINLARNTIKKRLHPSAITPTVLGDGMMDQNTVLSIAGFVGSYLLIGLAGTAVFSLSGLGFETCFSSSFLLLGNIGIGMQDVSPSGNFSIFADYILSFGSFLMLVGRLEIFTVLALFTKSFWKK